MKIEVNKGFVLSRNSYDNRGHCEIHLWVITHDGPVKLIIKGEDAVFFIEQENLDLALDKLAVINDKYTYKPVPLKTFEQKEVIAFYFDSLRSFFRTRDLLNNSGIVCYETGIRLEERFLMERFVYGSLEFIGDHIKQNQFPEYRNVRIKPSDYTPQLKVISLDIECAEDGELFSIGLYAEVEKQQYKKVIMIAGSSDAANKAAERYSVREDSSYIEWVSCEEQLLLKLETVIQQFDPDIFIGWNIINFDFRLLVQRARHYDIQLKLGRNNSVVRWRDSRHDINQGFISMDGRVVIDGIAALKAESYSFPSFSLEAIAQHFLGTGKLTDNVEDRLQSIVSDFKNNKTRLAAYNLQDCILVWDIFKKTRLLDFLIFRSQLTGLELDRAGGSVAAFTNLYLPKLHRNGYISPNLPLDGGLASPGGYVMNSTPGLYKNVLVLDFKSLYPSIIKTFKVDPLGLVEGLKGTDNPIPGFRGAFFSREQHLLPDIITELWEQREQAKRENDQPRSQAIKILMNSFYGVLGSGGCPFYDTRLASSITLRGHEIMQQTARWIEAEGVKVIYGDTDSTFVLLDESLSDEQANLFGEELTEKINTLWKQTLQEKYSIECYLDLEFESHFSKFLMPTIRGSELGSKKRYAGILKKGDKEELIFKGLENVRTDWTELAKKFQKTLYQMIFDNQDPSLLIKQLIKDTQLGNNDKELVYRKRLRRPLSSYVKNIPPHVKAARIADNFNQENGKKLKYQNKGWISYLITINGPQPLEVLSAPIDYQHYIDKQIKPVAEAILPFVGLSFETMTSNQLGLFN